jgi:hypothetical protein
MKALDGEKVHATSRNVLFLSVERNILLANMCLSVDCIVHATKLFIVWGACYNFGAFGGI